MPVDWVCFFHNLPQTDRVACCFLTHLPALLPNLLCLPLHQDWLAHFPRQQLLLLRYEDYKAALPQYLEAVLRFLDVPQPDTATWQAMLDAAVQNTKAYPAMRPDTRQLLQQFYAPFNKELLQALEGDCRWLWQDVVRRQEAAGA
jgi:N-acetylgalactosamine 4-sulfate 6-O-sulfotransferase